jgi:hypothetical protein
LGMHHGYVCLDRTTLIGYTKKTNMQNVVTTNPRKEKKILQRREILL